MSSTVLPFALDANSAELSPAARRSLVAGVLAVHVAAAWGLLQVQAVRDTVGQVAPLMVDLIAPAPPAAPPSPPPKPVKPTPPTPLLTSAPTPAPTPPAVVAPPSPEPAPPVVAEAPAAAPVAPEPAPAPKTIPDSAVQYLEKPNPVYPASSSRRGESGRVLVRVLIGTDGRAHDVRVARSSGHARLDEAALAAVRAARFKPHTENGAAVTVWSLVPIDFLLEN